MGLVMSRGAGQAGSRQAGSRQARSPGGARSRVPLGLWAAGLGLLLVASVTLAVTIGSPTSASMKVASILSHLGIGANPLTDLRDGIVWELRLPRILTAAAVGAGLALSGAVMQAITRNPLADPYLLGLSSGASLGAVSVLLLGLAVLLPLAAFLGSMLALGLTLLLASSLGRITPTRTVLAGLAVRSPPRSRASSSSGR